MTFKGETMYRVILYFLVFVSIASLSGCSSSGLVNMWRDPAYNEPPMKTMLVIAVRKNPANRRIWEDGFVAGFATYGVKATPSYQIFNNAIPDTQAVIEAVREHKFEGVLIARKLSTDTVANYVPGYVTTEPVTMYNGWSNMYYTYYRDVEYPGYTETQELVRHEVNVWSAATKGGRLVWMGTGEFLDPTSSAETNREITEMVLPELSSGNLIPPVSK